MAPRNLNTSISGFLSKAETPTGILLKSSNAIFELTFYRPDVCRIRIRKIDQTEEPVSYAVMEQPGQVKWQLEEREGGWRLSTDAMTLEVDSTPIRVRFYHLDGTLLSADDPAFGTSWIGQQVTTYKALQEGERFIGLGEKTGPLDRRGNAYVNWNTDDFAYAADADPLYLSTPFYMGLHSGHSYGIFLDNTFKTTFNFGASTDRFSWFSAEDGEMDYYFFAGNIPKILEAYTWLTGRMALPPKWSLGYQQCRYSYYPDKEVLGLARTFRDKEIPADVIYLDIHYMDGYRVFTFDGERFSDPAAMMAKLKEMGFHVVVIVDPGIKKDPAYPAFQSGEAGDHFIRQPDGTVYHGQVWPGWSAFPDFTKSETRKWWGEQFSAYTDVGIDGFWNDMNEPAAWGQSLPSMVEFDWEGHRATLLQARNVYGMNMARATKEGSTKLLGKRPFVLTRAGFSGIQRHAAVWTGDNVATDEHFLAGVRLVNSMGLTGIPYAGYDVGGFAGEASPELYARWIQVGAFSPFFRGHSVVNSRDSEPWSFGEQVEEISRNFISLRYQLTPYMVSAFYEAHKTGMPVARSLAIDYQAEPEVFDHRYHNQYLYGGAILVVPVESTRDLTKMYLPSGNWFDFFDDQLFEGGREMIIELSLEKLPLFVKAGSLIMAQNQVQSMAEATDGVLRIHAYAGGTDSYRTQLYEDQDQPSPETDGQFVRRTLRFDGLARNLLIEEQEGEGQCSFKEVELFLHGYGSVDSAQANGEFVQAKTSDVRWLKPISQFDPTGPDETAPLECKDIPVVRFALEKGPLELKW